MSARHDPERVGFITSSPKKAGIGFECSVTVYLPKLGIDGTADKVRALIKEQGLDIAVAAKADAVESAFDHLSMVDDEVNGERAVELVVTRTFGVAEAAIVCFMYNALTAIVAIEETTEVLGGYNKYGNTWLGRKVAMYYAKFQRRALQTKSLMEEAEERANKMAEIAKEGAEKAAKEAQDRAREAAEASMKAAKQAA